MRTKILTIISVMAMMSYGCLPDKKKDENQNINYSTLAEDAAITESISSDMFRVIDDESKNGDHSGDIGKTSITQQSVVDTCAIVTLNTNSFNWPMTLTIDFGTGCTDAYGVHRKGKVTAVYSGPYRNPGSTVTVTTDNYFVNGYKLDGLHVISNDGRNNSGNLEFTVSVTNGVITKPDGGIITWESSRTNEWTAGESTTGWLGICDDVYLISGFGEGTTSDGQSYRIDITSPLEKRICCRWVTDGAISLTVNNNSIASIDYGTGTCDPNANLNYGGNTYVIIVN